MASVLCMCRPFTIGEAVYRQDGMARLPCDIAPGRGADVTHHAAVSSSLAVNGRDTQAEDGWLIGLAAEQPDA
jgi:hypothetical protein